METVLVLFHTVVLGGTGAFLAAKVSVGTVLRVPTPHKPKPKVSSHPYRTMSLL